MKDFLRKAAAVVTLECFVFSTLGLPLFASEPGAPIPPAAESGPEYPPGASVSRDVTPEAGGVLSLGDVRLWVPPGAVKTTTTLTVEELRHVHPLEPGMKNLTAGQAGFRFLPRGMRFEKEVRVTIPYSIDKASRAGGAASVYTHFFDEKNNRWERLERVSFDPQKGLITSLTTHFTELINSTLALPETPDTLSFNPTSIKDIEAANPAAGINLIEPPEASHQGSANLRYPIEIPPGRAGMQPDAAITYNSDGANGWLGAGWDLQLPSITVETRWGVPRYDAAKETETYLLEGGQLLPLAHRGTPADRSEDKRFYPRIEGAFQRIIRHGSGPSDYWWEVTEKDGETSYYGGLPDTGFDSASTLSASAGSPVFRWALRRREDSEGNRIDYSYDRVTDSGTGNGSSGVIGVQLYPDRIAYTGYDGENAPYTVSFQRDRDLEEARRIDPRIDARAGFKVVTADLLRRIEVKFQNRLVRRYELVYTQGAFHKSLLSDLIQYGAQGDEFNRHSFSYYDDIRRGAAYTGFAPASSVSTGTDRIGPDLLGTLYTSAIGSTTSSSAGGHFYGGVGPGAAPVKSNSAGFKTGFSSSRGSGLVSLVDLNGDGLPDKVFKNNGGVSYRPNRPGPGGTTVFGPPVRVPGLSRISQDNTSTISFGGENHFLIFASVNNNGTITTGTAYFSDVNGDGLVDHVDGGTVKFNRLVNGVPTFAADSAGTPSPITPGSANVDGLVSDFAEIQEKMIDNNPLLDAVRVWRAPFGGTVNISGDVKLKPLNRGHTPPPTACGRRFRYGEPNCGATPSVPMITNGEHPRV